MLVDLSLFLVALTLGLAAAMLGRPKPPALDPARLLSVCWSALLWGVEEQADGSVESWSQRVAASLLYHPALRHGWRKLDSPVEYEIPVPSRPSERGLVEALAKLEPGAQRFERFFGEEGGRAALLDDPRALGDDYEPGRWLGHGCDWETLARWDVPVQAAVLRRLAHHHLVIVAAEDQLEAAEPLQAALAEDVSAHLMPLDGVEPTEPGAEALAQSLLALAREPADRLVLVVLGDAGPLLLAACQSDPVLRDRVVVVVLDGCPLKGVPEEPPAGLACTEREVWIVESFTHEVFDTEIRRATPYCVLARLSPDAHPSGDGRVPWAHQRVDEPPVPHSGRRPIAMVELGVAPADRSLLDPVIAGRGIILLLAFLLGEGAPRP